MSDVEEWSFPESLQAEPDDVSVDLDMVLNAVVSVRTEIPDDAFTASILGTERVGNGVVIDDNGVVLTIGYLITEAETIWLTTNDGSVVPGYPLGYDQATGFGLIQPLGQLDAPKIERGSARNCNPGDSVLFVGQGGRQHALKANLVDKREFAGYWEYVLDEALFIAPAHPQWGGAALVGNEGKRDSFEAEYPDNLQVREVRGLRSELSYQGLGFTAEGADEDPLAPLDHSNCLSGASSFGWILVRPICGPSVLPHGHTCCASDWLVLHLGRISARKTQFPRP